jgi:hypothetical protein
MSPQNKSSQASQAWSRNFGPLFRGGYSDEQMRVSDAERQAVADRLAEHYGDGRLDQAEFDDRMSHAMSAKTRGDLRGLFDDLPEAGAPVVTPGKSGGAPVRAGRRHRHPILVVVLAIVFVVIAVHTLAWAAASWLWLGLVALVLLVATGHLRPHHPHDHHHHHQDSQPSGSYGQGGYTPGS